jgi:hypothetical protein
MDIKNLCKPQLGFASFKDAGLISDFAGIRINDLSH